jgi:hypothetical protein
MKLGKFNLGTKELVVGGLVLGTIAYFLFIRKKKKPMSNFVNASGSNKKTSKSIVKKPKLANKNKGKFLWYTAKNDIVLTTKNGKPTKVLRIGQSVVGSVPFIYAKDKQVYVTIFGAYKDKDGNSRNKTVSARLLNPSRYMPTKRYQVKKQLLVVKNPIKKSFKVGDKVSGIPFTKNGVKLVRIINAYKINNVSFSKDVPAVYLQMIPSTPMKSKVGTMPKVGKKPTKMKGKKNIGTIITPNAKVPMKIPSRINKLEVPLGSNVSLSGEDDMDTPTIIEVFDPNVGNATRLTI